MPIPESILLLIEKYLNGKASPEEKTQVTEWYHLQVDEEPVVIVSTGDTEEQMGQRITNRLHQSLQKERAVPVYTLKKQYIFFAAAVILLVLFSTFFYLLSPSRHSKSITKNNAVEQPLKNIIVPGRDRALLTLADGSTVLLDSVSNGKLTRQGSANVIKLPDGRLAYTVVKGPSGDIPVLYNTIVTPKGGQYQLTLADGTKVWLNASSSIHFPTAFSGKERHVEIAGEAYFEVAENKRLPFKVAITTSSGDTSVVEVLGTRFNVNAYRDESFIRTTLLQGAVKIRSKNSVLGLSPGQQSELNSEGALRLNKNADLDEVVSWKNGLFNFAGADIKTIMRQIGRWYDLDVSYEGKTSQETFSGIMSRNSGIEKVLHIMEQAGVNFTIQGRKITVRQ